jgi:hypothetical protein
MTTPAASVAAAADLLEESACLKPVGNSPTRLSRQ